ncbi:MAG: pantetheine-phosphate adenylyltransferase [Candidatus Levyibacteriota bacterium]
MFDVIVVGGTFDRLHKGHKNFLSFALSKGKRVIVGLTTNTFARELKGDADIFSFEKRLQLLRDFFSDLGVSDRVTILPIQDVYGITTDANLTIDAIVVTEDSQLGAKKINKKRESLHLLPLTVVVCPLYTTADEKRLSSSRIRQGEVDTEGNVYFPKSFLTTTFVLPEELRQTLQQPFGKLIANMNPEDVRQLDPSKIVTVGDIVTRDFNAKHIGQKLSVVDFFIERKKEISNFSDLGFDGNEIVFSAENPAGHITTSLISEIKMVTSRLTEDRRFILFIDGEEDLAVLPLILALPLGFTVFYGQPKEGAVIVPVTEVTKRKAFRLLTVFDKKDTRGY